MTTSCKILEGLFRNPKPVVYVYIERFILSNYVKEAIKF